MPECFYRASSVFCDTGYNRKTLDSRLKIAGMTACEVFDLCQYNFETLNKLTIHPEILRVKDGLTTSAILFLTIRVIVWLRRKIACGLVFRASCQLPHNPKSDCGLIFRLACQLFIIRHRTRSSDGITLCIINADFSKKL